MLMLKQTKTPRLALKNAYVFLSGGPKLAVVSLTSDECSRGKKYSTPTSFWFDLLCSLIVCWVTFTCENSKFEGLFATIPCLLVHPQPSSRQWKRNMQFKDHLKWFNILTGLHNTVCLHNISHGPQCELVSKAGLSMRLLHLSFHIRHFARWKRLREKCLFIFGYAKDTFL